MHRIIHAPRTYRHRGHRIVAIPRVAGPDGWRDWLVCPDNGGASWYAASLADARKVIEAEAEQRAIALRKAESDRVAAALSHAKDREIRLYGRPLQPGEWPPGWIDNSNSRTNTNGVA